MIDSELMDLVYQPPSQSMELEDWPTLGAMIDVNTRLVLMLDYGADDSVPWLMHQFEVMWETPFSPTDNSFPCTPHRPPDRPWTDRQKRLYMANHNLNVGVIVRDVNLLVPDTHHIDQTNNLTGPGSVGTAVEDCVVEWGRPPNIVLVDFAEKGQVDYSVMKVVAQANDVPWRAPLLSVAPRSSCAWTMIAAALSASLVTLWIGRIVEM